MMNGRDVERALLGFACLLLTSSLVLLIMSASCGCTPAETNHLTLSIENAAAVSMYDTALVGCQQAARQRPREQRFEAYVDCEQAVSRHFCDESESLRKEWSRCLELDAGDGR